MNINLMIGQTDL